jgi:hypothetical protein
MTEHAKVTWAIEDIKNRKPKWSDDECREFLCDIEGKIQDAMCEAGWSVIDIELSLKK